MIVCFLCALFIYLFVFFFLGGGVFLYIHGFQVCGKYKELQ